MGMSLMYYDAQIGFTMKNKPKQAETAVEMNSEDQNKLSMAFISPKTMKCSPMQLHFPHGPYGSPSFLEAKMAERHLYWLCNLFQWLQNAHNSQN